MPNCEHTIPDPSCDVCRLQPLARNHYFDGKFMAAYQFQVEQDYVRGANMRQNAYLHGMGTVCGLKIAEHDNPDCRNQYVVLQPGLAIDCCGREIVVPDRRVLDIRQKVRDKLAGMGANPPDLTTPERPAYTLRILLSYRQHGAEEVPALLDDCDDGSGAACDQIVEDYDWDVTLTQDAPPGEGDPSEPSLSWKQTLTVARPVAAVADRDTERLFVAETDAEDSAVRVYDTETHNLLARGVVHDSPGREITAIALSRNGERLYVALTADGDGNPGRILLIDRAALEADALPLPSAQPLPGIDLAADQRVVALAAAMRDDALLALTSDAAGATLLRRWSADALADFLADPTTGQPASEDRNLSELLQAVEPGAAAIVPVDMVQDLDGRWLLVADAADTGDGEGRLVAISLAGFNAADSLPANFICGFGLGAGRSPTGIDLSYDGRYAYAVVTDGATPANTSLLRLQTDPGDLTAYLPEPLPGNDRTRELPLVWGEDNPPEAFDVAVTPRDNFAYILRRGGAPGLGGDVLIADIEVVEGLGAGLIGDRATWLAEPDNATALQRALRTGAVVQGAVDFQTLAPLGSRLYVATHREPPPPEEGEEEPPPVFDGRLRVYDIDEVSCDAALRAIVEACPTCGSDRALVVASIRRFWLDQNMLEAEPTGDEPFNLIDNFSERPLAPSNVTLLEVIQCLIAKGIAEGIPGPRGPQGEAGPQGEQGVPGVGLPGPRGPGIVEVAIDPDVTQPRLEPILNDPEGDFTLVLPPLEGRPQREANHVIAANFAHEEILDEGRFELRFTNQGQEILHGILIAFEQPVRAGSVNNRTAYATIQAGAQSGTGVMTLPLPALPVLIDPDATEAQEVELLDGYVAQGAGADLLRLEVDPGRVVLDPTGEANGVLLVFPGQGEGPFRVYRQLVSIMAPEPFPPPELFPGLFEGELRLLTVVLRGDQIVTFDGLPLDGNHIGRADGVSRSLPSGNGTPGGDWVAVMHLRERTD